MRHRIIRTRLVVLSSLSLLTLGVLVGGGAQASAAPSHTTATGEVQLLPNGVFGWD
jgi:hypothetical protein